MFMSFEIHGLGICRNLEATWNACAQYTKINGVRMLNIFLATTGLATKLLPD